jgi:hypothetical protein
MGNRRFIKELTESVINNITEELWCRFQDFEIDEISYELCTSDSQRIFDRIFNKMIAEIEEKISLVLQQSLDNFNSIKNEAKKHLIEEE